MKLNEMKIKIGEKIVESPRLLKEEKLEILACIKEEKDPEILESLLLEYGINLENKENRRDRVNARLGYEIATLAIRGCLKRANKIEDQKKRELAISKCKKIRKYT